MRVLHLTTTDAGGAGRAAVRLHNALRAGGIDSRMLVARGSENASQIPGLTSLDWQRTHRWRRGIQRRIDVLPLWVSDKVYPLGWAPAWCPGGVLPEIRKIAPDIIHLHWITGFVSIKEISALRRWPLFWSLHDLWPLSEGYPYLGCLSGVDVTRTGDLSRLSDTRLGDWIWKRKKSAFGGLNLQTIGLSRWIQKAAQASELFREHPSHHIPNCLPFDVYRPHDRALARKELGLPIDSRLILFGAANPENDSRKGFDLLLEALAVLDVKTSRSSRPELVVFGSDDKSDSETLHGFRIHRVGSLDDDRQLARLYSAANVFVAPSREDNLPNTIMEALACGTPCAAFDVGGVSDLIEQGETGFLAPPFDAAKLAEAIVRALESDDDIGDRCREFARRRFSPEIVVKKMNAAYLEALGREPASEPGTSRSIAESPVLAS